MTCVFFLLPSQSYLDKADILNKRGIFSSASNMTRLRTQLGIDVNEIVDVNSLKRHVVDQIKEVCVRVCVESVSFAVWCAGCGLKRNAVW